MVGILLVTHGDIGLALFKSAIHILGKEPSNIDYISINSNIDINSYEKTIQDKLISLDNGKSWNNVTRNIPNLPNLGVVRNIEASKWDAGKAYLTIEFHQIGNFEP